MIHVTATRDFLESLAVSRPLDALSELIWNGFDAESDKVKVHIDTNVMNGIDAIRVRDYGVGIRHVDLDALFGGLGDSWKRSKARSNGRALHGKNGKGRFKAFALGELIEWHTTYRDNGKLYTYKIVGKGSALDDFEATDPVEVESGDTGTEVRIQNTLRDFHSLLDAATPIGLAKTFGAYLTEYPYLSLTFNGALVDPKSVQRHAKNYDLGDVDIGEGNVAATVLSVVEWTVITERALYLCDSDGITLHQVTTGPQIRAPGFNFTAYVRSSLFRELDANKQLGVAELRPDTQAVLKVARNKLKEHFRLRLVEQQSEIVQRWKQEDIYPYEDAIDVGPVAKAERQVFDILAVNVQSYLPSFDAADVKSKKFTFRLLARAVHENPESLQDIIGEVLGLKKDDQDELAELLRKTPLSSIIRTARIVADRLDFLLALENLVFDKDSKKTLLERDQLHKILEKESWLFREDFTLAGSEQRLEEVLQKHVGQLGQRADDSPVELEDGKTGRIDLMLHKVTQPRDGEFDYLVVELKRPSQKINQAVLSQVENYAIAVANDERFRQVPARWTFMAVSTDFDEFAKRKANQANRPSGMSYDDSDLKVTVWAKSWAEIINDARARLRFINQHLSYEASRESATAYLKRTHSKFIPSVALDTDAAPA